MYDDAPQLSEQPLDQSDDFMDSSSNKRPLLENQFLQRWLRRNEANEDSGIEEDDDEKSDKPSPLTRFRNLFGQLFPALTESSSTNNIDRGEESYDYETSTPEPKSHSEHLGELFIHHDTPEWHPDADFDVAIDTSIEQAENDAYIAERLVETNPVNEYEQNDELPELRMNTDSPNYDGYPESVEQITETHDNQVLEKDFDTRHEIKDSSQPKSVYENQQKHAPIPGKYRSPVPIASVIEQKKQALATSITDKQPFPYNQGQSGPIYRMPLQKGVIAAVAFAFLYTLFALIARAVN